MGGSGNIMAPQVALVYGSFVEDNSIDFDSLKDLKALVLCCSSRLGHPPPGFHEFARHLWEAANTNPGCLSHLSHCVYGNGDPEYERTYMNMPRYMDALLERCGSKRVLPRGEFNEPNTALKVTAPDAPIWAPHMWSAMKRAIEGEALAPVSWDALWAETPSPVNQGMVEWTLIQMSKKAKRDKPTAAPSMFAKL